MQNGTGREVVIVEAARTPIGRGVSLFVEWYRREATARPA